MYRRPFVLKIIYSLTLLVVFIPRDTFAVTLPTLINQTASSASQTSENFTAQIDKTGGENPTERGFEYGTTTSYGLTVSETGSFPGTAPFSFDSEWASSGNGDGQLTAPFAIVRDNDGNFYVSDSGNDRIQKFDSNGTYSTQFGTTGSGDGEFNVPRGIVINRDLGRLYVVDSGNQRVEIFDISTATPSFISSFGTSGTGDGQFDTPVGVAYDSGSVYVVDSELDRVQQFDPDGVYIAQFGTSGNGNGEFNFPQSIVFGGAGNFFVVDSGNNRIQKFSSSFEYLDSYGTAGTGPGAFTNPTSMYYDSGSANFYVVDSGNSRVQKFDSGFVYLGQWGESGGGDGEFSNNTDIFVSPDQSYALVVDSGNDRIQQFSPTGTDGWFLLQATDLSCNTQYHYRPYAINTAGTGYGSDGTFTTPLCSPTASTGGTSNQTVNSITLAGTVTADGGGEIVTRGFEYGTTTSYGSTVAENGSFALESFTLNVSSLSCGVLYHYRAYAVNAGGNGYGDDATFTLNCDVPTVSTATAYGTYSYGTTLSGGIDATGGASATARGFQYGTTTSYGSSTVESGSFGIGGFTAQLTSLSCNTTYHFRAYATNSGGTGYGSDDVFTTGACFASSRLSSTPDPRTVFPDDGVVFVVIPTSTRIYISGSFTSVGGITRNRIAAINTSDGSLVSGFNPDANNSVTSMTLSSDGSTLYVGGNFTTIGGITRNRIAAINTSDGSLVSGFNPNITGTGVPAVRALTLSPDGNTLYIGGNFTAVDGTTRNNAAAVSTSNGTLTSSFNPNAGSTVSSIALSSDGSILYVGGIFTTIGGITRNRIAAINTSDGSLVSGFNPGIVGSNIGDMTLNSTGSILYVGGTFSVIGGITRSNIASVNTADGTTRSFNPNVNGNVAALALSPDESTLYMLGAFTTVTSFPVSRNALAEAFTSDGSFTVFDPNLSGNGSLNSLHFSPSGDVVYAGGGFGSVGGNTSYKRFASFSIAPIAPSVTTDSASSVAQTSVTLNGTITSIGTASPSIRGFQYGTTTSYGTTTTESGSFGTGVYTADISGLSCNTTYHFRAYATNTAGTSYGSDATFTTTTCAPTLTTDAASSITTTTATLNATITATGGASATIRGFQYGTTTSYGTTTTESGSFGTGVYTADISGLSCNTTYHFRAYATNTAGTSYGSDVAFGTSRCPRVTTNGAVVGIGGYNVPQPITLPHCVNGARFDWETGAPCPIESYTPPVVTTTLVQFTRPLRLGMRGEDVRRLQQYLNTHHCPVTLTGIGSKGKESTYFGQKTRAAVICFQNMNKQSILEPLGLKAGTGIVGALTAQYIASNP